MNPARHSSNKKKATVTYDFSFAPPKTLITEVWTYKSSTNAYLRTTPIAKWNDLSFIRAFLGQLQSNDIADTHTATVAWRNELGRLNAVAELLPDAVSAIVESLLKSEVTKASSASRSSSSRKIVEDELEESAMLKNAIALAKANKRRYEEYMNVKSASSLIASSTSESYPQSYSFLVENRDAPSIMNGMDIKELLGTSMDEFEAIMILDAERIPQTSSNQEITKALIARRRRSKANLMGQISDQARTFIDNLQFRTSQDFGEYLSKTYLPMCRSGLRCPESRFVWKIADTILGYWDDGCLLNETCISKTERWWLAKLHGPLTSSLESVPGFRWEVSEIECISVKEQMGPSPPKYDGVGTATMSIGEVDICLMEAKPVLSIGSSGEQDDREKIHRALACLFLALERKLPPCLRRFITDIPLVCILMTAHKMIVQQARIMPGNVMVVFTLAEAKVPPAGFKTELLRPILETSLLARAAVAHAMQKLECVLSEVTSEAFPTSPPASPIGEQLIHAQHKSKKVVKDEKKTKRP